MTQETTADLANDTEATESDPTFLNAVLENAGALLVVLDRKGRICRFNKACERLSGYSFEEVKGKFPWETFLPPEDAEMICEQAFEALVKNPQAKAGRYNNYWQSKDGSLHFIDWYNTLLLDDNGQVDYMISNGIDITKHKQVQAELQQAREEAERQGQRNRVILATTMDGYGLANMQGQFIDANSAFLELLGYSRDELLRLSIPDIDATVDPESVKARFKRIVEQGYDRFETRHHRKDGSIIDVEVSASSAEIGGESFVFGFEHDITARKQVEQDLRNAKEAAERMVQRHAKILQTTLDGFMAVSSEGRIIDVNPAYEKMLGYSREEFLRMRIADIELLENHEEVLRHIERVRQQGYERFESTQRHKDGSPVDVEVSVSMLQFGDEQIIFAFVRDITARRESERELLQAKEAAERMLRRNATILQTTLDGFMIVDMQGRIIDVNPAYQEMLGYSRKEFLSMQIADIEFLENHEDVLRRIERIKRQGYERFESIQRHKDGNPVDVEVSVSMLPFGDEEVTFAFVRDITARRKSERELLQAKEAAEQASKAKSQFLSRMSHELRTPMNAILGFSQLLELENLTEDQKNLLGEITHAGDHLLHLIDELLDLSRIEAGKMMIEIQPVAVMPEMNQALAIVQPLIAEKGLSIKIDCIDYVVNADSMRLKQVLVNLLNNAAKYNRQGGEIEIHCEVQRRRRLRISITDSGPGIRMKDQARLFTPFERLDAGNRGIDGTGIGLVLCRHIVDMMEGDIGLFSEEGKGSTFWIELPLADNTEQQEEDSQPPHEATPGVAAKTVLYVEDNAANMRVVQALFRHYPNMKLLSAITGDEGLALIKRSRPDLVLLDIHLPDISGFEVLEAMRNDPLTREIPVIALSADVMAADIEKALQAGFDRYLPKPLDTKLLITEISTLLYD